MRDRLSFGATCRVNRAVAKRALLTAAAESLRPYNLTLIDIRFLQSCTRAAISGGVLKRMLYIGEDYRWPQMRTTNPPSTISPTLDVYCAKHEGIQIAVFLTFAAGYIHGLYTGSTGFTDAIRIAYTLTKPGAPNINIFEARSENPLDLILRLPTTADMGAWLLDRIWHAYPKPTFEGLAMTTPTRLLVNTTENRQRAWHTIQTNLQDGYWIDSQWAHRHQCLSIASCPSSWRKTRDRGCLTMKFPSLPFTSPRTNSVFEDVSWTLGTITLCTKSQSVAASFASGPRVQLLSDTEGIFAHPPSRPAYNLARTSKLLLWNVRLALTPQKHPHSPSLCAHNCAMPRIVLQLITDANGAPLTAAGWYRKRPAAALSVRSHHAPRRCTPRVEPHPSAPDGTPDFRRAPPTAAGWPSVNKYTTTPSLLTPAPADANANAQPPRDPILNTSPYTSCTRGVKIPPPAPLVEALAVTEVLVILIDVGPSPRRREGHIGAPDVHSSTKKKREERENLRRTESDLEEVDI
ncbi:hypothetical protein B0H13DRAFT_2377525 [Mycena leptocephala]|nr:hypothetical protein B0H13DRAFT_2377525 [Mycena leptocephala]